MDTVSAISRVWLTFIVLKRVKYFFSQIISLVSAHQSLATESAAVSEITEALVDLLACVFVFVSP